MEMDWNIPHPWKIEVIKPVLHAYGNNKQPVLINNFEEDPKSVVDKLSEGKLLPATKIYFITHGFENNIDTEWLMEMKDAILTQEHDATVILVGWGGGAYIGISYYSQAAANTIPVGTWLATYVQEIRNRFGSKLILCGIAHSLGAHLLGIAGRKCNSLDRISALDPAGPSFEKVNQEHRLRRTDAKVVDVIHTDGYDTKYDPYDWFSPVNHYGTLIPIGTVDFYPNWGYKQPGATSIFTIAGSHHRAIELYMWSISNPGKFMTNALLDGTPAFEAPVNKVVYSDKAVAMGFYYDCCTEGLYYIKTNFKVPWV